MTAAELDGQREALYEKPCFVIDFLPRQVPAESGERYFAAERYFRERPRLDGLYARFARLVLCLNCYYPAAANRLPEEDWIPDPAPETLEELVTPAYCHTVFLSKLNFCHFLSLSFRRDRLSSH